VAKWRSNNCNIVSRKVINIIEEETLAILMEDDRIQWIIEELRFLRIRVADLELKVEQSNTSRTRVGTTEQANVAEGQSNVAERQLLAPIANGLRNGDRVRFTNKVRKPATARPSWTEEKEQLATVTNVTATQVHVTTDNQTKTWRVPNNLQLLYRQGTR
jgi:hypothetical protein